MNTIPGKRSFTGNHPLLPAMRPLAALPAFVPKVPTYTFFKWSLGRGSVIWKIWPAVLLHTLFAAAVVYVWVTTHSTIDVPNVMLTVMGVVIGFVISYRAVSGYDRYWLGRTIWSDVIRNSRTMGRLMWYHVPPRLTPGIAPCAPSEHAKVMAEKRMALDLVEAYTVALKHHLRGEVGIYYEDLYDLVQPLHDFANPPLPPHTIASAIPPSTQSTASSPPPAGTSSALATASPAATIKATHAAKRPAAAALLASDGTKTAAPTALSTAHGHAQNISTTSLRLPLEPAARPAPVGVMRRVDPDAIPFAGVAVGVSGWLKSWWRGNKEHDEGVKRMDRSSRMRTWSGPVHPQGVAQLEEYEKGENLPEEILRCLSEWLSVLERRGTVPGTSMSAILAGVQTFEATLTTLEQVLTTPLPFVYSVHIRVVWLYLFLLPLQIVNEFRWYTIPAVAVGAFVYLGFVEAGEEIEQPFGYDDNDLDLDMFCRDIVRPDIQRLKQTPCLNAWFPPAPAVTAVSPPDSDEELARNALSADRNGGLSANVGSGYAYGGSMYRASLASLSDAVSSVESGTVDFVEGNAERGAREVREAELVDVR